MDTADPLKASRRLQAQRNADKVRLQPFDYIAKSVAVNNKKENFQLEKSLDVMNKDVRLTSDNMVRDKKHFVEERRRNLRQVIPSLKQDFLQRSGKVRDPELIQIVQYYEQKYPNIVKHTQNDYKRRSPRKPTKLKPLNKPMSISLQDISSIANHDTKHKSKGLRAHSKLEILAENLPVARFRYSIRDGHSDKEKASLRTRDTGVISCPAFYLETGGRTSSLSREASLKVHSSLALHGEVDEHRLPVGAADLLLGNNSRAASRITNRYETPTPVLRGYESKLSMHNDVLLNQEASTDQVEGKMKVGNMHSSSPLKSFIAHNRLHPQDGDILITSPPSTDRSHSFRGVRKQLHSQSSEMSHDTLAGSLSTKSSNPTPTNTAKASHSNQASAVEFPVTKFQPANKRVIPQTGKPYHSKPHNQPSSEVTDILDKHLPHLQPAGKKELSKVVPSDTAILKHDEAMGQIAEVQDIGTKKKRKESPRKLYKNDKLISSFLVPSDVKKLCNSPFDPHVLALSEGEITDLGSKQRVKETEDRLKIQKEFYKTAQGNVQHWISDVDAQMKKDRLKYITNF